MRAAFLVIAALIVAVAAWFAYQNWPRDDMAEAPAGDAPTATDANRPAEAGSDGPAAPGADQMARRRGMPAATGSKEPATADAPAPAPAPGTAKALREPTPKEPPRTAAVAPDAAERKSEQPATAPVAGAPAAAGPSFDVVRISRDCTAVIAGRALPNAVVTVLAGGAPIGQVTADRRGEWVLMVDSRLPSGAQRLSLSAAAPDGAVLPARRDVVLVVPDCTRPAPDRGPAIALLEPKRGSAADETTRVLQAPPSAAVADKDLNIGAVDYDEAGNVALTGKAEPGTQVQAYVDNQLVGKAEAEDDGSWRVVPDDKVRPGVHQLRIDQVDDKGKVMARVELPFSRAAPGDLVLAADRVVVQPGNSLWRIARRSYGRGLLYTVIYEANREQISDPDLIYPGQVFVLPSGEQVPIN